jgi:hypothetical protein
MHSPIGHLFSQHVLASFGKQLHLAEVVGPLDWHFDLRKGSLSFGNRFAWQTQLLGTESEQAGNWLWGWANPSPGIAAPMLEAALSIQTLGAEQQIDELTQPEVSLGTVNGHFLSLIASGICRADAYYRAPYSGGAAFLLIKDEHFPASKDPPLLQIATVFPQAISSLDIPDHKLALIGYLDYFHLMAEAHAENIIVMQDGKPVLTATFDLQNRLTKLQSSLPGQ